MKENKLLLRFSLLFLLAGNVWDLLLTVNGLRNGAAGELNPLLAYLYGNFGIYYLVLSKLLMISIVASFVFWGFNYTLRFSTKVGMIAKSTYFIFAGFAGGIAFFCAGTSWLF